MQKLLLAISCLGISGLALADSFQDFNNNAYLQYGNVFVNQNQAGQAQEWTLGATVQTRNNIWINATATGMPNNDSLAVSLPGYNTTLGGSTYGQFLATAKAGYAFQFGNNGANGFQVIPYATYTYGTSLGAINQYYGLGVKPEYRLGNVLKVSLDMTAYDATQAGGGAGLQPATVNPTFWGQANNGYIQDFRYTINPEVQYDIAKTILLGVGYSYDNSFNQTQTVMNGAGNSTLYAKLGYLF